MGLGNWINKKLVGDPQERQHKQQVKQNFNEARRASELKAATARGWQEGQRKPQSRLEQVSDFTTGFTQGLDSGLESFNTGAGFTDFNPQAPRRKQNSKGRGNAQVIVIRESNKGSYNPHRRLKRKKQKYNPLDY